VCSTNKIPATPAIRQPPATRKADAPLDLLHQRRHQLPQPIRDNPRRDGVGFVNSVVRICRGNASELRRRD
jgi:hypothetical protein